MRTRQPKPISRRETSAEMDHLDVLFALRRRGWTMSRLSKQSGHERAALRMGLARGTPWAMELVARVLGMKPKQIWPSCYAAGGPEKRKTG